jgi:hypothetical protein
MQKKNSKNKGYKHPSLDQNKQIKKQAQRTKAKTKKKEKL